MQSMYEDKNKKRRMQSHTNRYSAKLTSKYQATIPIEIRKHLHLKKGDRIVYELLPDNTVVIRKTTPLDLQYFHALNPTLTEWEFEDDEQAYKNL
jgi:antitoxin PrlF